MARYRVQTASGRFYDVDLSEGEDIESVVAEIERSEASVGGARGAINPPTAGQPQPAQPIDYSDAATAMMGTPAPAPTQGLIQRVGQALRPAPKSVLDELPSPELLAESQRAERDRRLSYGAGPIRPEVVAEADRVRSTRGTRSAVQPTSFTTERVVRAMDERGEESPADIIERVSSSGIRQAATQAKAEEFRSLGEWAVDTLSSVSQGAVSLAQLPTNIIAPGSALAENLRQVQKELQAEESDVAKASREVLRRRVESEEGFLGKYFATVKELVTNPTLSINEAIKQVPMFIGVVGAAKLGATAAGAGVTAAGRAAPTVALADAIGGGALTTTARAAGSTIGGVGASMVMAGGDAAGNTYETLTDKAKTPLSEWQKNPDYQKLVADGKTSDEAIQEIATAKARLAAVITAPLGILGFMGAEAAVAGRGVARAAMGAATPMGAARLLAKENITEQLEEGGTQFLSNVATSTVRQDQNLLEGVPEAMAAAAVTSTPFGALGAYSQYRQAKAEGASDPVAESIAIERLSPSGTLPISPAETMRAPTDVGPAPRPGVANFTPPDSPTKQAGLVDIAVPLPGAPGEEVPTVPGTINPATEQQFGLDKLRMGGANVGTGGVPGGLAGEGGSAGGGLVGGGMGLAGLGNAGAVGPGDGLAGVPGANDRQAVPAGGAAGQPLARLSRPLDRATDVDLLARAEAASAASPSKIWAGRAGDGYMQPQDAQQALPGLQRKYPDLAWDLRQDADGKFFWAGTTKGANLEATTAAAPAAQGQEVTAAGALAGQGQAAALPAGTAAGGAAAATQLPGLEAAGLRVAPTAPISEIKKLNTALSSDVGVTVSPVNVSDMSDQQKLASAVARLMGKTLTVVRQETGTNLVPNGMINRLGGKHIYVAEDTEDAPLFVAVHEAYHGLPEDKRQVLNKALLETFRAENKQAFLDEFGYDPTKFDEEAPAMIAQVVSKREDFWQDLRTKMGNKEFGEVAKVILSKLSEIVTGARAQYGDDFVKKYITDIEKARDLLSTAYADAMKAQGLQPDVEVSGGVMASNRAADVNKLGMYSELARKLEAGPNQAPVDQWKAYIKGLPQKGVKPDEIEWSGVEDFLELKRAAGQKVTKAEVAEYLKQGGVQVEETVLGNAKGFTQEMQERLDELEEMSDRTDEEDAERQRLISAENAASDERGDTNQTKYSKYTLPGGENYREVLLTLPVKSSADPARAEYEAWAQRNGLTPNATMTEQRYERETGKQAPPPRTMTAMESDRSKNYKSGHWDQPNVLAHIRLNDRTDAEGKRVLFVEELQSDWGQEGKKKGFAAQPNEARVQEINARLRQLAKADMENDPEWDSLTREKKALTKPGVPSAPFVTKTEGWLNLALKRVMVMAAEGGYDRVAFTTGAQNAKRYSLENQVSSIRTKWSDSQRGERKVDIVTKEPMNVISLIVDKDSVVIGSMTNGINGKTLDEVIGKEMAQKVMETDGEGKWSGLDLKVGGEGMKTFYDTIVPTALKKLLPKVGGGQMRTIDLDVRKLPDVELVEGMPAEAQGFDVTDAMREKVTTSGLPMFSQRAKEESAAGQAAAEAIPVGEALIAIHNLTTENLLYADEIGGLPVPSIGVTKAASPFYAFGNITLLAPRGMVDPATGTPVFDRDAYTSRFPVLNYKRPSRKAADALYEKVKSAKDFGDDLFVSQIWDKMVNDSTVKPDDIVSLFDRYSSPRAVFARDVLIKTVKVPMRDVQTDFKWVNDKQFMAAAKPLMEKLNNMGANEIEGSAEFRQLANMARKAVAAYVDKPNSGGARLVEALGRNDAMESLVATFGNRGEWITDESKAPSWKFSESVDKAIRNTGKKEVDRTKLDSVIDKLVSKDDPAYVAWYQGLIKPLFDQPTITLRGKQVAPTLDNIVDAMTAGGVAGAEKTMTSGVGKVSAMLGKRFKSLDEIKAARSQVVSTAQEDAGKKGTEKLLNDYRAKALEFFTETDWRGNVDTWASMDAAMEALAVAGKGALTDGNVRVALQRKGFKGVDQETIDLAKQGVDALRSAVTDYFEAKPQRAVSLSEFRGAVVPKGMDAKALEVLAKNNIEVVEFNPKKEGDREAKLQKLAKKLDKADGDIMFSRRVTINVDGKERPTTNSSGQQIAGTDEALRNFWRWFGDSKVVDENGRPLVVYHGTGNDFSTFMPSDGGEYGAGIYLTPDAEGASSYARYRGRTAPNVMPVYVSIKNPAGPAEAANIGSWRGEEAIRPELIRRGYDGIIDKFSGQIVAFRPEQIKSAIGNSGTFDPENPDIRFSNRAAKPELDADVVSIFRDLDGARGLALIRARERVDAHPMAETIRRVNDEFLDILERLDDAGLVKINCK